MSAGERETVNLDALEPQQLAQVKKQLDEELEHLTSSFSQLHGAQGKFNECLRCVNSRSESKNSSNEVLVPLTNSLYVRGELTNTETVLVDKLESAATFYENKIKELTHSLKELEAIVQQKQMNVRTIEEVLRQKLITQQSSQSQS
ncbi:putative prefoldin subunit 5 [Beauveria bassiana]|nr:putative prefoldin subunit 5 [Beauveria bassiana]